MGGNLILPKGFFLTESEAISDLQKSVNRKLEILENQVKRLKAIDFSKRYYVK